MPALPQLRAWHEEQTLTISWQQLDSSRQSSSQEHCAPRLPQPTVAHEGGGDDSTAPNVNSSTPMMIACMPMGFQTASARAARQTPRSAVRSSKCAPRELHARREQPHGKRRSARVTMRRTGKSWTRDEWLVMLGD